MGGKEDRGAVTHLIEVKLSPAFEREGGHSWRRTKGEGCSEARGEVRIDPNLKLSIG